MRSTDLDGDANDLSTNLANVPCSGQLLVDNPTISPLYLILAALTSLTWILVVFPCPLFAISFPLVVSGPSISSCFPRLVPFSCSSLHFLFLFFLFFLSLLSLLSLLSFCLLSSVLLSLLSLKSRSVLPVSFFLSFCLLSCLYRCVLSTGLAMSHGPCNSFLYRCKNKKYTGNKNSTKHAPAT